jgi:hypothetical protein
MLESHIHAKGRELERQVFEAVQELLGSGTLGLSAERCRIFLSKAYYSRDRKSDIETDVSLELWPRGGHEPSLIWIWECKAYATAVPVDDIEEFHAKLEQIGGHRAKGTMVATKGFQRGTVEYAVSKGIGLVRMVKRSQLLVHPRPGFYTPISKLQAFTAILSHEQDLISCELSQIEIDPTSDFHFFAIDKSTTTHAASMLELVRTLAAQLIDSTDA